MRRVYSALGIVILIGCSRTAPVTSLPASSQPATSSYSFQTLFVFKGNGNGIIPAGAVLGRKGVLYGATNFGGTANKQDCYPGHGCGTVYEIDASDKETVLHRFKAGTDGARPYAGLTEVYGNLYGTTQEGGKHNKGTVYAISTSGSESVLHTFRGRDGNDPRASLSRVGDTLYGTTYYGGSAAIGTVFAITTSGAEQVLHSFLGGTDGALPLGSVINVDGVLYGTTSSGGTNNDGTVFEVSPSGSNYCGTLQL